MYTKEDSSEGMDRTDEVSNYGSGWKKGIVAQMKADDGVNNSVHYGHLSWKRDDYMSHVRDHSLVGSYELERIPHIGKERSYCQRYWYRTSSLVAATVRRSWKALAQKEGTMIDETL